MIDALRPQMSLTIPRLSDEELAELVGWCGSLEIRHGCDAGEFCRWLDGTLENEIKRRTSQGAIEMGSVGLPPMGPKEVSTVLMVLTARTYCEQTQRIAAFFDECLKHVVALAAIQLCEFQTLCEAINEKVESEE